MTLSVHLTEALSSTEKEACQRYEAEATMLHATCQGRSSDFEHHPDFKAFSMRCAADIAAIDSAIQKCEVSGEGTVFSGHGVGIFAVGSLRGDAGKFVGLDYSYPGFVSTSQCKAVAEDFIRKRARNGTSPVLLEIKLRKAMAALDFSQVTTSTGEFEYLLSRQLRLSIVYADYYSLADVPDPVLRLVMEPP